MEVGGCLGDVLSRLDDLEEVVWEPYHKDGPGRPPRNPLGIFKALIVKRLRSIPSDRKLYRRLWSSPKLGGSATLKITKSLIILPSLRVSDST